MARLVNPGAGDLSDRLTILALKIHFAEEAGRETTAYKTERTALLSQIRSRTLNGVWFETVLELAAVNAALWHAEDDLRMFRGLPRGLSEPDKEMVINLAFQIQATNDRRAALIDKINKDAGDQGGEKL